MSAPLHSLCFRPKMSYGTNILRNIRLELPNSWISSASRSKLRTDLTVDPVDNRESVLPGSGLSIRELRESTDDAASLEVSGRPVVSRSGGLARVSNSISFWYCWISLEGALISWQIRINNLRPANGKVEGILWIQKGPILINNSQSTSSGNFSWIATYLECASSRWPARLIAPATIKDHFGTFGLQWKKKVCFIGKYE